MWRIQLPTSRWIIIEIVTFMQLFWLGIRFRERIRNVDVINFLIAYPSLVFWKLLKPLFRRPVVITEHWSGYHFNFGVCRPLRRIMGIFSHNIPVIAVSQALGNDIRNFAGRDFPLYVIPNVVSDCFSPQARVVKEPFFFMVSQWKTPKDPLPLLSAFKQFNSGRGNAYKLYVGGYGPLYHEMQHWKLTNDDTGSIVFLGKLTDEEIADRMNRCVAFLHPTNYETFSVVCAEAVSCGAFVIAPKVGGIPEVVGASGMLLDSWNEEDWTDALDEFVMMERSDQPVSMPFSASVIGGLYKKVLDEIVSIRA